MSRTLQIFHAVLIFFSVSLLFTAYPQSLLFATTNHIERLDPALSRPGRMDVWVNFKNATKWQAEGIFKCFFPSKPSQTNNSTSSRPPLEKAAASVSQDNIAVPKRKRASLVVHTLSEEEISALAKRFGDAIPEDEFSVSLLFTFWFVVF